jgi:hypothetical protein
VRGVGATGPGELDSGGPEAGGPGSAVALGRPSGESVTAGSGVAGPDGLAANLSGPAASAAWRRAASAIDVGRSDGGITGRRGSGLAAPAARSAEEYPASPGAGPVAGEPDAGGPDAGGPNIGALGASPPEPGIADAGTPGAGTPEAGTLADGVGVGVAVAAVGVPGGATGGVTTRGGSPLAGNGWSSAGRADAVSPGVPDPACSSAAAEPSG